MKFLRLFAYAFSLMLGVSTINAAEAVQSNDIDECSKELLISYFPESFVSETLKKFNVPQDKWSAINKDLSGKEKDVVKLVEDKAEKLNPNPLKDPSQRLTAVKIFRETLLQIFTEALKKNGVNDDKQIQAMLDDVQQQKAKRFAQCMEKHKSQIQGQQKPALPTAPQAGDSTRKPNLLAQEDTKPVPSANGATGPSSDDDHDDDNDNDDDNDDDDNQDKE